MMFFFNLSIKIKISLIIIGISLFAIILSFSVISINNINTLKKELVTQNSLTAKLVSEYIIFSLAFDDKKDAEKTLDKLSTQTHIKTVEIYDAEGIFFTSFKNKQAKKKQLVYKKSYYYFDDNNLHIFEPIIADNEFFGTIYIESTTEYLDLKVKKYFYLMLIIGFIVSLIVIFLANTLQNIISKPILKLANITTKISKTNNYSIRINKIFNDEIGILYEGFNNMLEQIVKNEIQTRKAKAALEESEEQFSLFMQMLPAGAFIKRANSTYKYVNEFLINEFDAKKWLNKKLNANLPSEKKHLTNDGDKSAIENIFYIQESVYDKNNKLRYFDTWKFPIKRKNKETLIGGFSIDVTKTKIAEKQINYYINELERNNKELEEFNYVASHDLREPLRTITSYCELLKDDIGDKLNKDSKEDINFITDASSRMNILIQDILQLSRAGRVEFSKEKVDLNYIFSNIIKDLEFKINENNAIIKFEKLPNVKGDAVQLARVFQNLITNALKFKSEKNPKIEITSKTENEYCFITVADNGIGIEKQYYNQIFSAFKRLHSRDKYEGTGIGLAICKKIVERHNGKITLESKKNIGTKFTIKLEKY